MKSFIAVLALPAMILPALASTTTKDLAVLQKLQTEVAPLSEYIEQNAGTSNAPTVKEDMKQLIADIKSAADEIEANSADVAARAESPGTELLKELDEIVTEVGTALEAFVAAGSGGTDTIGDLADQLLGELTKLGESLASVDPTSSDTVDDILTSLGLTV